MKLFSKILILSGLLVVFQFTAVTAEPIIAVHPVRAPYVIDNGDMNYTGIYPDIIQALADNSQLDIVFRVAPNARLREEFKRGEVHIEAGIHPSWRADDDLISRYSIPFQRVTEVVIFTPGREFPFQQLTDLAGKDVLTVRGFHSEPYINRVDINSEEDMVRVVARSENEYSGLTNKSIAQYYMNKWHVKVSISQPFAQSHVSMRLHKSIEKHLPQINQSLKKLLESGKIDSIRKKYLQ